MFLGPPLFSHGWHQGDLDYKFLQLEAILIQAVLIFSLNSSNISPSWFSEQNISHLSSAMFLHLSPCPSNSSKLLVPSSKLSIESSNFQCWQEPWGMTLSALMSAASIFSPSTLDYKPQTLDQCKPLPDYLHAWDSWEHRLKKITPLPGLTPIKMYGPTGTLTPSRWQHKLVPPLRKTIWQYLQKLNVYIHYDLAIPVLGIYLTEMCTFVHQKTHTYWDVHSRNIHNTPNWNLPKCLLTIECRNLAWLLTRVVHTEIRVSQLQLHAPASAMCINLTNPT